MHTFLILVMIFGWAFGLLVIALSIGLAIDELVPSRKQKWHQEYETEITVLNCKLAKKNLNDQERQLLMEELVSYKNALERPLLKKLGWALSFLLLA